MSQVEIIKLPNGFTILLDYVPHVERAALGIWCRAGSRFESAGENGLSHFLEHMFFRGSKKYSNEEINTIPDSLGMDINAYTDKGNTAYYASGLKEAVPAMIDLLTDMVFHPTLPKELLEIERGAILAEIDEEHDDPSDFLFSLSCKAAFGSAQSIGRPILGPKENVSRFMRDDLEAFLHRLYTAQNMVFVISGNFDRQQVIDLVSKAADHLPSGLRNKFSPVSLIGGEAFDERPVKQVNLRFGCEASRTTTQDSRAESLYGHIMGSGMSSRLYKEIREKRGLVYSLFCGISSSSNHGSFALSAGLSPENVPTFIDLACAEISRSRHDLREDELHKALISYKNSFMGAIESIDSRANNFGKYFLNGNPPDFMTMFRRYETVTIDDVREAANRLFQGGFFLAAIGPANTLPRLEHFVERLSPAAA